MRAGRKAKFNEVFKTQYEPTVYKFQVGLEIK